MYILTIQSLPTYALLRAQGVPGSSLVRTIIDQSFILMGIGTIVGLLLALLTSALIPLSVPISINSILLFIIIIGMLIMGFLGAIFPAIKIAKVNAITIIGS